LRSSVRHAEAFDTLFGRAATTGEAGPRDPRLLPGRDPVAVREAARGTILVVPGGGRYTPSPRWANMEHSVFGHPREPRTGDKASDPASRSRAAGPGPQFEAGAPCPDRDLAPPPPLR
jgi:hypothetical protein